MDADTLPSIQRDHALNWELVFGRAVPAFEQELVERAADLRDEAISVLSTYRSNDLPAVNLGVIVRVREDVLGPRIIWVRFAGKARNTAYGSRFTPTEPIKMQGRWRYSARIFSKFPEDVREQLIDVEKGMSWIRYRTERLAALRDLCRKSPGFKW